MQSFLFSHLLSFTMFYLHLCDLGFHKANFSCVEVVGDNFSQTSVCVLKNIVESIFIYHLNWSKLNGFQKKKLAVTKSQLHTWIWCILVSISNPSLFPSQPSQHIPSLQVPYGQVCLSVLSYDPWSLTRSISLDTSSLALGGLTHGHTTKGNDCRPSESTSS